MKTYLARFVLSAPEASVIPVNEMPQVAIVGRSNSGKSTLINVLVGIHGLARVSQRPGKTRAIHFYDVEERFMLVDLPGYGFASVPKTEKVKWQSLVDAYLQSSCDVRGVVALFDVRRKPDMFDKALLELLKRYNLSCQAVWTKTDKLKNRERLVRTNALDLELATSSPGIAFSSKTRLGRDELLAWIEQRIT